ncbi:SpoU rRNA Methylase family protein [Arachidicoccus rhizosphaerae]|uniref:SpoU rRNA Methylase family protein n=2 Tax=Arachidicoccus rhizosphaerae TaxID=551991 RepID=A0A1H3Z9L2_9BACT|nr:SpoU rRNA Methylase family protein [Arachidicoccus rhizosphaerae]
MDDLGRLSPEEFKAAEKMPLIIILDNIRSMHNVGSVFRTADAFLCEQIMLCGYTPQPPHRDIHKTALGATETVAWSYFKETAAAVAQARQKGYAVYAVEQAVHSISTEKMEVLKTLSADGIAKGLVLILGNEVQGVEQQIIDLSDGCLEIPQYGTKHSLNISVAAGIVIWESSKLLRSIR